MTSFVRAEYVIAVMLVECTLYYKDSVKLADIGTCGVQAQRESNERGLDAIFKVTLDEVRSAVKQYSDYFQVVTTDGVEAVTYANNKDMTDLINYFTANIPFGILSVLREVTHSVCKLVVTG